jgi:hypothetical protein
MAEFTIGANSGGSEQNRLARAAREPRSGLAAARRPASTMIVTDPSVYREKTVTIMDETRADGGGERWRAGGLAGWIKLR